MPMSQDQDFTGFPTRNGRSTSAQKLVCAHHSTSLTDEEPECRVPHGGRIKAFSCASAGRENRGTLLAGVHNPETVPGIRGCYLNGPQEVGPQSIGAQICISRISFSAIVGTILCWCDNSKMVLIVAISWAWMLA